VVTGVKFRHTDSRTASFANMICNRVLLVLWRAISLTAMAMFKPVTVLQT